MTGVVAASLAFMIGRSLSNLYLIPKQMAAARTWKLK
jgi:hypothetical protein